MHRTVRGFLQGSSVFVLLFSINNAALAQGAQGGFTPHPRVHPPAGPGGGGGGGGIPGAGNGRPTVPDVATWNTNRLNLNNNITTQLNAGTITRQEAQKLQDKQKHMVHRQTRYAQSQGKVTRLELIDLHHMYRVASAYTTLFSAPGSQIVTQTSTPGPTSTIMLQPSLPTSTVLQTDLMSPLGGGTGLLTDDSDNRE